MEKEKLNKQYLRIRNFLGTLGCLLPILSISGAAISPNTCIDGWWYSISVTYHSSPVLTAILSSVAFFLLMYRGYNKWDTLVNTIAGIAALGVVIFPCECPWLMSTDRVGLFWLPIKITKIFHYISAAITFSMLSLNSIWLFAKGNNEKKKLIYRICGIIMLSAFTLFGIFSLIPNMPGWHVIIWETIMLFAFGISWLVKGHLFDKFLGE